MTIAKVKFEDVEMSNPEASQQKAPDSCGSRVKERSNVQPSEMFPLQGLLCMYRPVNDVISSVIVHSKNDGVGYFEIGKQIGVNVNNKLTAKKVSHAVRGATRLFPDRIDHFTKMMGRQRCFSYFFKDSVPANLSEMVQRLEGLAGVKCPFTFGQIFTFPGTGLNTLQVSDVTFQRFVCILEMLHERKVIVPSHKILRHIEMSEQRSGYLFDVDKKSVTKCLLALQKCDLCRILTGEHEVDGVVYELEAVVVPSIATFDEPRVYEAIERVRNEYAAQERIFPSGQPMKRAKREKVEKEEEGMKEKRVKLEALDEKSTGRSTHRAPSSEAKWIRKGKMSLPILTEQTAEALMAPSATPLARPRSALKDARAAERLFTHKYAPGITDSIIEGIALLREPVSQLVGESSNIGTFLLLSDYLAREDAELDVEVPDGFDSMFVMAKPLNPESEATPSSKNLRVLEDADLQVLRIEVHPSKLESTADLHVKYRAVQKPHTSVFPKPWILPSGELNFPVLKRMAESILVTVASSPGIPMADAIKTYDLLQSSLVVELVEFLEEIGCLAVVTKQLKSMVKSSPFEENPPEEIVKFLMPAIDTFEKFALFIMAHHGETGGEQKMDVDAS